VIALSRSEIQASLDIFPFEKRVVLQHLIPRGALGQQLQDQFEDFASQVLPDIELVKNKVVRPIASRTEAQDPLSDPFLP
jgi:hypothetical protein